MKIKLALAIIPFIILLTGSAVSASHRRGDADKNGNTNTARNCIQFRIKNIKTTRGKFWLAFYKEPHAFPKKGKEAFSRLIGLLKGHRWQTTQVCDLEKGWYAVAAFQDLDENGDMNLNFIGLPLEPYGFSNDVHPIISAPTFQQCRFYIDPSKQSTVDIDLINP